MAGIKSREITGTRRRVLCGDGRIPLYVASCLQRKNCLFPLKGMYTMDRTTIQDKTIKKVQRNHNA